MISLSAGVPAAKARLALPRSVGRALNQKLPFSGDNLTTRQILNSEIDYIYYLGVSEKYAILIKLCLLMPSFTLWLAAPKSN